MNKDDDGFVDMDALADSRQFMREQVRQAATQGNSICSSLLALEALAGETPYGSFVANEMQDYDEDDSDLDVF